MSAAGAIRPASEPVLRADAQVAEQRGKGLPNELLDQLDWFAFVCHSCGSDTYVGREPVQTVDEFREMCSWLYGDPPICTYCLRGE